MARLLPMADLYALSRDPNVEIDLGDRAVYTTFLNASWLRNRRSITLPLMPIAWKCLGKKPYRIVLTSHHALASSNRLAEGTPDSRRLLYVHTPARYIWDPWIDGRGGSPLLAPARHLLRGYDRKRARTFSSIAANSREVAGRINHHWGLDCRVIYPPVDIEYFSSEAAALNEDPVVTDTVLNLSKAYLLSLGRWIPYKNPGFVISLAEDLGVPAIIAGSGPLGDVLRRRASAARVPVHVIERPTRPNVRSLLQGAKALIFPACEDFGIVPVESMAAGTPVVALAKGGATETVKDGVNGFLVPTLTTAAFGSAIQRLDSISSEACRTSVQQFSRDRFANDLKTWMNDASRN